MTREEFLKQVNEKLNATVENVKEANGAIEKLHKDFPKSQLADETVAPKPTKKTK